MKRHYLASSVLSLLLGQASWAQDIAAFTCSPEEGVFSVRYIPDSDQGQNSLSEFPVQCEMRKARYVVKAVRGPYSERRCGAMPTVDIVLYRNRTTLIRGAVFGENCFMGPSLREIVAVEERGTLKSLTICIAPSQDGSANKCRVLGPAELAARHKTPIDQIGLGQYLEER
ncbi:hypothetical protein [Rhizobacter sp. OV335]|uniref:hypothetical protein n=1 Tax=Rhizobacter sp. OV335 TaxID=1500264 RepID=UPI0011613B40|nr:hypothetical protein [Rhizobacter sp. OV335]